MSSSASAATFEEWREQARRLLSLGVRPDDVIWNSSLFANEVLVEPAGSARVPRRFVDLARTVAMHRDPSRWSLLYGVLWRLNAGEKHLLDIDTDDDVRRLMLMSKAVHRDIHKMHAFVRFRRAGDEYIAWHRPDHLIVREAAEFFVRRFGAMHWAILTPDESAYWNMEELRFGPGVPRSEAPQDDELEGLWRSYYASVFNPSRLNLGAMKAELPVRHWATLPEAAEIPRLIAMAERQAAAAAPRSAAEFVPVGGGLEQLRAAVQSCEGCELFRCASRAVFGEGPTNARVVLVGEQPGDQEDLAGRPFVGPAGEVLNRALAEAGIDRSLLYLTNAVKHFKFEERGKRRIHQTPRAAEITACRPWLEAELAALRPERIVCLGASAAQSVFGKAMRVNENRRRFVPSRFSERTTITVHPSAILRIPDAAASAAEYHAFVEDLRVAAR